MFWDKEKSIDTFPPLTQEMIDYAEQQLQVKLPAHYIELLMQQNGGAIYHKAFPTNKKNSWAEDHVHLDEVFGIEKNNGILKSVHFIEEWNLPKDIVLFAGDGHSWFAFDYRETKELPKIIYIEADNELIIELASSFEDFVNQLYTHTDIKVQEEQVEFSVNDAVRIFESNEKALMIQAFNILYDLREENGRLIERWVLKLLQHEDIEIRKWAGHYAYVFKELGVWTSEQESQIIKLLQQDPVLESEYHIFINI